MASDSEIGKAKITVEADISGLKPKISDAKKEVESLGETADTAGKKTEDAFTKAGKGIEGATGGVRKLAGAFSGAFGAAAAVAGAILGIVNVVKELNKRLEDGEKIANRYLAELDTVRDTAASFESLKQKLIEVNAELEYKERGGLSSLLGRRKKQIEEEADAIRSTLISVSRQLNAQRAQEARDAEEAAKIKAGQEADAYREQLRILQRDAVISLRPDDQQLSAQIDVLKGNIIAAAKEAGIAYGDASLQSALAAIEQQGLAQLAQLREQERLKDEAQAAREAEADRRSQERIRRETEAIRESLSSITADYTTLINNLTGATRDVANALGRLK